MNLGKNIPTEAQASMSFADRPKSACQNCLSFWLVDAHEELRGLLADLLSQDETIRCTRQFSSAEAVLDALECEAPPNAILLDVRMDEMSGVNAIRPIRSVARSTHVFAMANFYDGDLASRAFNAGASGFLLKRYEADRTIECIRKVVAEPAPARHSRRSLSWAERARNWVSILRGRSRVVPNEV
jgi:DNA-binding NarL/FixJ family response regulator